jgi:hypothetical protein
VIGWLNQTEGQIDRVIVPFNQGLAETGYVVGRKVALELRDARIPSGGRQLPTYTLLLHASCEATINCSPLAGGS